MYLHLGSDVVVETKHIIAILDLDSVTMTKAGKDLLLISDKKGELVYLSETELPKSLIITRKDGKTVSYLSYLNTATLLRRKNELYQDGVLLKKQEKKEERI